MSANHQTAKKLFGVPAFVLTEVQRQRLKQPLGELITGTPSECIKALRSVLEKERPSSLILVGDTVSRNTVQSGIKPDMIVIDNREERREATKFGHGRTYIFRTTNQPGTIELEAWNIIEKAIGEGNSVVLVEGEEDLLSLIVILVAASGSLVVYGQPNEGIVLVRVSPEKKKEIQGIIDEMKRRN